MAVNDFLGHLNAMIKKERIVFTRYPVRILASITTPLFFIFIMGFSISSYSSTPGGSALVVSMFISIIGLVYLTIAPYAAQAVIEDQQQGTIESLFLAPVPKFTDIFAKMIVRYSFVTLTIFVYYAILRYLFGEFTLNNVGIGIILVISLIGESLSFSFILAGLTLKYKETAARIGGLIPFIALIFSGMFIPISALPQNAKIISLLLPFTYSIDAIRGAMAPSSALIVTIIPLHAEVILSILIGFILPIIGALYYLRVERSARYTGTLLEY